MFDGLILFPKRCDQCQAIVLFSHRDLRIKLPRIQIAILLFLVTVSRVKTRWYYDIRKGPAEIRTQDLLFTRQAL